MKVSDRLRIIAIVAFGIVARQTAAQGPPVVSAPIVAPTTAAVSLPNAILDFRGGFEALVNYAHDSKWMRGGEVDPPCQTGNGATLCAAGSPLYRISVRFPAVPGAVPLEEVWKQEGGHPPVHGSLGNYELKVIDSFSTPNICRSGTVSEPGSATAVFVDVAKAPAPGVVLAGYGSKTVQPHCDWAVRIGVRENGSIRVIWSDTISVDVGALMVFH